MINLKFEEKNKHEIETIINFDNFQGVLSIFTTRNATIKKLYKLLGIPYTVDKTGDKIFGAEWRIPFDDRVRVRKALSLNNYYLNK